MRRYRCVKCGTEWFTASLREGTRCGHCQGELEDNQELSWLQIESSITLSEEDTDDVEK